MLCTSTSGFTKSFEPVVSRTRTSRRTLRCVAEARSATSKASVQSLPAMEDGFLGVRGLAVPPLGIGLAALGRPGYINLGHDTDLGKDKSYEAMQAQAWQVLDAAYAAGIRYFDAARSYGRAEEMLSGWIKSRGVKRGDIVVGSKWGYYYNAGWRTDTGGEPHEIKEHTRSRLNSQQEETQALLGSHLNLYQIHSATLESGVLQAQDVLEGLEELKTQRGWRIGLSLSGVKQAETLRMALGIRMKSGGLLFDSVQATWNLMEQSVGPTLLEAHQAGLNVIVKEGMANGRILQRPELQAAAKELSIGADALALACIMVQPFKPMVLSGAATTEQLRSNAAALQVVQQLQEKPEVVAQLQKQLAQDPEQYWKERSALAWN